MTTYTQHKSGLGVYNNPNLQERNRRVRRLIASLAAATALVLGGPKIVDSLNGPECSAKTHEVVVESGDTFFGIASDVPGGAELRVVQDEMEKANPEVSPSKLHPGQVLNVPDSC